MRKFVFATNNAHKLREVSDILGDKIDLLSMADIGCHADIPETADTLEGNALIKARYIYDRYHVDCFADDTGLEVAFLHGDPGVHTARYAGEDQNSEANVSKLLRVLQGVEDRRARFRTVFALILDGNEYFFEGIVNGFITDRRKGTAGFGYDPIFIPEGNQLTFAEMGEHQKNLISHRGRAAAKLCEFLFKQA